MDISIQEVMCMINISGKILGRYTDDVKLKELGTQLLSNRDRHHMNDLFEAMVDIFDKIIKIQ